MSQRRVVVTGMGIVSPVGNSLATAWDSIVAGRCGIGQITHFDAGAYATRIAANLDSTSRHANSLLAGIERGEGNAGKLLRDTLLYNDLRNVVTHVDSVLADLKANPRKYINLSIF